VGVVEAARLDKLLPGKPARAAHHRTKQAAFRAATHTTIIAACWKQASLL
jgi:hypothetical protein